MILLLDMILRNPPPDHEEDAYGAPLFTAPRFLML
jgi:hypothetical protein